MKEESVLGTLLKTTDKLYPGTFSWDVLRLHQATDYIQAFPWDSSQSAQETNTCLFVSILIQTDKHSPVTLL